MTSVGPGSAVITAKAGGKSATCQVVVIAEPGLSADSIIIGLGDTRQIKIYPAPEGQPAVWQSQDPEIAQVDQAGNIIGRAPGNTQVTVDIGEEKLACQVHVFALDSDKLILAAGEAAALQITNAPAGEPVDWKSSDPRLVSIESSGEIFAAAQGEVVVTATIAGGTAKCAVTVLGLNPHYLALDVGDTQQLQLNPAPEGVVWSSEDAGVVQVDQSGQVTAVASGSSKVFASVAGKKVEATILVATDISRHRTASLTGTISQLRSFNADGSMLISYFPPFGGANENRAVLVDGQGKEYSLPFAPCSDVRWFGQPVAGEAGLPIPSSRTGSMAIRPLSMSTMPQTTVTPTLPRALTGEAQGPLYLRPFSGLYRPSQGFGGLPRRLVGTTWQQKPDASRRVSWGLGPQLLSHFSGVRTSARWPGWRKSRGIIS